MMNMPAKLQFYNKNIDEIKNTVTHEHITPFYEKCDYKFLSINVIETIDSSKTFTWEVDELIFILTTSSFVSLKMYSLQN